MASFSTLTENNLEGNTDQAPDSSTHEQSTSTTTTTAVAAGVVYPDPNNPYKCISNGQVFTLNDKITANR
jgi:hypothetical protein